MKNFFICLTGIVSGTAMILVYIAYPELFLRILMVASIPLCWMVMRILKEVYAEEVKLLQNIIRNIYMKIAQFSRRKEKIVWMDK